MPIVSESIPDGSGPNASIPFGQGTETSRAMRELSSRAGAPQPGGPPGQGQPPAPQPGGPPPAATQPEPQSPGRPYNDPGIPMGKDGHPDMGRVFSDVTTVHTWKQNATTWAAHPAAGSYLKMLGTMAESHQPKAR